jgi:hypothetical protein
MVAAHIEGQCLFDTHFCVNVPSIFIQKEKSLIIANTTQEDVHHYYFGTRNEQKPKLETVVVFREVCSDH